MFRNDAQICACARVLLRSVRQEKLWTETGSTEEAIKLLHTRGGYLSSGERLMLFVAFDFWNGQGNAEFPKLINVLDSNKLRLVCTLAVVVAEGATAIDRWLIECGGN